MTFTPWDPAGDEPVYATRLLDGAVWHCTDIADLKGSDATNLRNNDKAFVYDNGVDSGVAFYKWNSTSSTTGDDYSVVNPTLPAGNGRWELQGVAGGSSFQSAIQATSHGFSVGDVVNKSTIPRNAGTTSHDSNSGDLSGQIATPQEFHFIGARAFGIDADDTIYEYSCTADTPSSISYTGNSFDLNTAQLGAQPHFDFNSDLSSIYMLWTSTGSYRVYQLDLTTPGDITDTITSVGNVGTINNTNGICLVGDQYIYMSTSDDEITCYYMSTPSDISTASNLFTLDISAYAGTNVAGIAVTDDHKHIYILTSDSEIYTFYFPLGANVNETNFRVSPDVLNVSGEDTNEGKITISEESGQPYLFYTGWGNDRVYRYPLPNTPWSLADPRSPAGCNDVYFVSSVPDANSFVGVKKGIVTWQAHGLPGASGLIFSTGDVDDYDWQSQKTMRHTWGAAPAELSGVSVGDWVWSRTYASQEDPRVQYGYYKLTAVEPGSNYVEWDNIYITDNTADLTALTDDENQLWFYGAGSQGDVCWLSEDGYLSPFPANGGAVELPILSIIDDDTVYVDIPVGIPALRQNKILISYRNQTTPNDADDNWDLLWREVIDMSNPQNWHLKFNIRTDDGTSDFGVIFSNVTHEGGRFVNWLSSTPSATAGDITSQNSSNLELTFEGTDGASTKFGYGELIYDGNELVFYSHTFSSDGSFWKQRWYHNVDMSNSRLYMCGNTNLDTFDLWVERIA